MSYTNELNQQIQAAKDPATIAGLRLALRRAENRAEALMIEADTDSLTGLMNRRGLSRRVQGRDWGWYVSADLDGFKAAQDAHPEGHTYGDTILREFAEFLLQSTRQGEMRHRDILAARSGGDEFSIWTETRAGADRIQERIRAWASAGGDVRSSAGVGLSMAKADRACYDNKHTRKGN